MVFLTAHGSGNFDSSRRQMVSTQLKQEGIVDQRVLDAMLEVSREEFVPKELRILAYSDRPLPIGHGQTISQPYTVAFMCEAAQLLPTDKVLEIGTGSGYGAAVLSRICREVHTVEIIAGLCETASNRLSRLNYANVHVHLFDGSLGLQQEAPFDAIIVTAGAKRLPEPYVDQLVDGGRVVIPLGATQRSQVMFRFTRVGDEIEQEELGKFAFVPLVGELGWQNR